MSENGTGTAKPVHTETERQDGNTEPQTAKPSQPTAQRNKYHRQLEQYPLHRFDNNGRLKPPAIVYWVSFYLLRGFFVVIAANGLGANTKAILGALYPNITMLYAHLIVSIPAIYCLALLSYRTQIYDNNREWLLKTIKPTLLVGILLDFTFHLYLAHLQHWQFSWNVGLGIVLSLTFVLLTHNKNL